MQNAFSQKTDWLYQEGAERSEITALGQSGRRGNRREEVEKESARSGRIGLA